MNSTTEPFERVGAAHPFARWAIATMRAECSTEADGAVRSQEPADGQPPDAVSTLLVAADGRASQELAPGSLLWEQAADYLARSSVIHHAAPDHQPSHVFELTDKLFAPYDVDGGQINLAGCILEDRPLLRLTCLTGPDPSRQPPQLEHLFMHPDGQRVEDQLVSQLRLDEIMPYAGKPPRLGQAELEPWVDLARQQLDFDSDRRLLTVTVVWCKYAAGKIRFNFGDQSAHVPFAGWAQLFATGQVVPPPFHCEDSGGDSYHVRHTDDGTITVESSLAVCESSGATVLVTQLRSCAVTGRRVLPRFLQTCPVSGQQVLPDQTVVCQMCSQHVSPEAIKGQRCAACRRLQPISKDDPRLARVLGEYPRLDEWRHWRVSELAEVYLLVGNTLLKQILLVIEKDRLELRHIASGGRILGNWAHIEPAHYNHFLR